MLQMLTPRMGLNPFSALAISTMLKVNFDVDAHAHAHVTCKQALRKGNRTGLKARLQGASTTVTTSTFLTQIIVNEVATKLTRGMGSRPIQLRHILHRKVAVDYSCERALRAKAIKSTIIYAY